MSESRQTQKGLIYGMEVISNMTNKEIVLKFYEEVFNNWDVSNIYGGTIKTTLTQESFENKFKLRPIPLQWLNSLSNGHELGNNPGW